MRNKTDFENDLLTLALWDSSSDAMRITSINGNVIKVNKSYCTLTDFKEEDLTGNHFNLVYSTKEGEKFSDQYNEFLLSGNNSTRAEKKVAFKNGNEHFLEVSYSLIKMGNEKYVLTVIRDITDFMKAVYEINDSKIKYENLYKMIRLMCDNSTDLIWAKDLNNKYIFANKAMCENLLISKDTDEPVGKDDMFFAQRERDAHKDNSSWHTFGEICRDSDSIVLKDKKPGQFDEFGNVKGKFLFLNVHKSPIFDENGNIIGVVGSGRDVTGIKKIEEQFKKSQIDLERSEHNYKNLVQSSHDVIIMLDTQGNFKFINKIAEELTGYKISDWMGKNFASLVHPEDLQTANSAFFDSLNGKQSSYDVRIFNSKGETLHIDISTVPVFEDGIVTGVVSICRDVTRQKLAEEKLILSETTYRGIINTITEAVYIMDENGIFLDVNETSEKMYGYKRQEFFGKTPEFLSAPGRNDLVMLEKIMHEAFKGIPHTFEFWGLKKDGTVFPKDVSLTSGTYFGRKVIIAVGRDISERIRAEEKLIAVEKQQSIIFNSLPVIVYSAPVNPEIDTFWVSESVLDVTGYTHSEYRSEHNFWSKRLHPDDAEKTIERFNNIATLKEISAEYRWKVKSGEYRWFLDKAIADKNNIDYYGVIIDITNRKKSEEELQALERQQSLIFKSLPVAVYSADINPDVDTWWISESILDISGYSRKDYLSEHDFWSKRIHPDDAEKTIQSFNNISRLKEVSVEYRWKVKSGEYKWFFERAITNKSESKYFGVMIDINDKKKIEQELFESEERYKAMISNIDQVVIEFDEKGTYLNLWVEDESLLFAPKDKLLNKTITAVLGEELAKPFLERISRVISTGQPELYEYPLDVIGGSRWFSGRLNPVFNSENKVKTVSFIVRDITARKKVEEEIILKKEELEKLNAEKDKFFSIIAHDLRSPFTGFLGFTEMMMNDLTTMSLTDLQDISLRLNKSANNLYSLLNNLLEWSMMQGGLTNFIPENYNLNSIVNDCVKSEHHLLIQKNISLHTDIHENLSVFVDRKMVEFVFRNLLSNAIKFTPKHGNIKISASVNKQNDVQICVCDSGIGMEKELLDSLFKLSAKVKRPGTDGEPSTGLGLILCKEFVEKNDGTIRAESEEGKGSKFFFTLKRI